MNKGNYEENKFGQFNLADFKKWMESQQEQSPYRKNFVGVFVESKIHLKKLSHRMDVQEGELEKVAKDFKENGGVINEVDGHHFLINVDSGSFLIHRMYVKRPD
jgi:hypothetical protein